MNRTTWIWVALGGAVMLAGTLLGACVERADAGRMTARVTFYDQSYASGINYHADESGILHPFWGSAAASWDIPAGSLVEVNGHVVLVIDRGLLGSGNPTHVDVYCDCGRDECERRFGYGLYEITILRWGFGQ